MTQVPTVAAVVEGHGEVKALPKLLHHIARGVFGVPHLLMPPPWRLPRSRIPDPRHLAKVAKIASMRVSGPGGLLVVIDADDNCAVELAERIRAAAAPVPVEVAVAVREFEAWFLASVTSLRDHPSVRDDAEYVDDPEGVRNAKDAISQLMVEPYKATLHQPAFASKLDVTEAVRRSRSFAHFVRCVGRLLGQPTPSF